jgi:hypothetical protein
VSTYLELVQDLFAEVDLTSASSPTTLVGATGEIASLARWVKTAWTEIQGRNGGTWRFLRRDFTFQTVSGTDTYAYGSVTDVDAAAVISRFRRWHVNDPNNPAKCYLTSSGIGTQYWLRYLAWESFQTLYKIGTQNNSTPAHITVNPQDELVLGPKPNGIYTVTGEFYRSAQVLSANSDTPEMHSDYHSLIVYKAMEKYGAANAAQEVMYRGEKEGGAIMKQLEATQRQGIRRAGPMA